MPETGEEIYEQIQGKAVRRLWLDEEEVLIRFQDGPLLTIRVDELDRCLRVELLP